MTWALWPSAGEHELLTAPPKTPLAGPRTPGPSDPPGQVAGALVGRKPAPEPEEEPRPGSLRGKVLDAYGAPLVGARIALVSDDGIIDQIAIDDEGRYALVDDTLLATRVVVGREERPLTPLMAGEERTLDLVVGETREVVGWVLDLVGDPVPGARITMRMELGGLEWSTWSDDGGAFRFPFAPATVVRVTADGGELGLSSARLARTNDARREVTLVLEPSGTIIVSARPQLGGEVIVRAFDAEAHGVDPMYSDDLRNADRGSSPDQEMALMNALGEALVRYDPSRPEDSLAGMAMAMIQVDPSVESELRRDAMKMDPNLVGAPLEEIVKAAVTKVMQEEPQVADMMARAAKHAKAGKSAMEAVMEATQEIEREKHPELLDAPPPGEAQPQVEIELAPEDTEAGELGEVEDAVIYEGEGDESLEGDENLEGDESLEGEGGEMLPGAQYGEAVEADPVLPIADAPAETWEDPLARARRETGARWIEYSGDDRTVVARGKVGDEIVVRGAFRYDVSLRLPEGMDVKCGEVMVRAGQVVELRCADEVEWIVTGRVVDTRRHGVAGLKVEAYADGATEATTDESGRFELRARYDRATSASLTVTDPRSIFVTATRNNVTVVPGGRFDVGTIVIRTQDETPIVHTDQPFGGVGAGLELTPRGIVLSNVGDDTPLALEGVEQGATLVAIDEHDALMLSIEDAVAMLRGDIGSEVNLRLRSVEGELYDVLVTHGLITPNPTPEEDEPELPIEAIGPQ